MVWVFTCRSLILNYLVLNCVTLTRILNIYCIMPQASPFPRTDLSMWITSSIEWIFHPWLNPITFSHCITLLIIRLITIVRFTTIFLTEDLWILHPIQGSSNFWCMSSNAPLLQINWLHTTIFQTFQVFDLFHDTSIPTNITNPLSFVYGSGCHAYLSNSDVFFIEA